MRIFCIGETPKDFFLYCLRVPIKLSMDEWDNKGALFFKRIEGHHKKPKA